ncbi:MAG: FAD/NAD(P)-binding protein, partial [Spirochaeta sp.]|nr:FAD/NAD(P)-binding protein [Spirochaeta sp.]
MNTRYERTDETASAHTADIVIVGTGIHGMHLSTRISADPVLRQRVIRTVDPADEPFALWMRRTKNCGMNYLRSPASHGLSATLPRIRRFARDRHREDAFIPPYHRPALSLFNDHIREEAACIDELRAHVTGQVTAIDQVHDRFNLTITTRTGHTESITAVTVILAVGNPPPHIPQPFRRAHRSGGGGPELPIFHVYDTAFDIERIGPASRVAIVGGGIAGAHLALNLQRRGASVDIWNRDPFYPAQFDSDPCFIGPRCGDDFREQPITSRREIITDSRRSGSVPPDLFDTLMQAREIGEIDILSAEVRAVTPRSPDAPGAQLSSASDGAGSPQVTLTGEAVSRSYDTVVLSTGFAAGPPAAKLIADTAKKL